MLGLLHNHVGEFAVVSYSNGVYPFIYGGLGFLDGHLYSFCERKEDRWEVALMPLLNSQTYCLHFLRSYPGFGLIAFVQHDSRNVLNDYPRSRRCELDLF